MTRGLTFKKSAREIKTAAKKRIEQLQQRLARRDQALEEFMNDRTMVRSLLVRAIGERSRFRHPRDPSQLHAETDISSEQMEEVRKVCERIFELEAELRQLRLLVSHLGDEGDFELTFQQLVAYGFEPTD